MAQRGTPRWAWKPLRMKDDLWQLPGNGGPERSAEDSDRRKVLFRGDLRTRLLCDEHRRRPVGARLSLVGMERHCREAGQSAIVQQGQTQAGRSDGLPRAND